MMKPDRMASVPRFTVLVINLDRDVARMQTMSQRLARMDCVDMHRITAVPGGMLPLQTRMHLSGSRGWATRAGEIGCFLSHIKAWEYVAASDQPYCVVLEDDTDPVRLELLSATRLPSNFHVAFINDRMSISAELADAPVQFQPVAKTLAKLCSQLRGPGTDGYLLTPIGATRLLKAVDEDGVFGHVDQRLVRYCIRPSDFDGLDDPGGMADRIKHRHRPDHPPHWNVLRGFSATRALVSHDASTSSRKAESLNATKWPRRHPSTAATAEPS